MYSRVESAVMAIESTFMRGRVTGQDYTGGLLDRTRGQLSMKVSLAMDPIA